MAGKIKKENNAIDIDRILVMIDNDIEI